MKFFKAVYKRWANDAIKMGFNLNGSWTVAIPKKEWDNLQMLADILKIQEALDASGAPSSHPKECYGVYNKYWPRIVKYATKKVKANGGYWPMLSTTNTIKELLQRGWVHRNDMPDDFDPKGIVLFSHDGGLIWPKTYEQHMEAMKQLEKVGIPGRTGTRLPK